METTTTVENASGNALDHLKKIGEVNLLMRMGAVKSVITNLNNEDNEMSDWYDRQNALLDGESSNGSLQIKDEEGMSMMVAGDHTTTINHNYVQSFPKQESSSEQEPSLSSQPDFVSKEKKENNPLLQNVLSAVLGASLLGGGIGLGNFLSSDPKEENPEKVEQFEDTDTIGILEPDRD